LLAVTGRYLLDTAHAIFFSRMQALSMRLSNLIDMEVCVLFIGSLKAGFVTEGANSALVECVVYWLTQGRVRD